MHLFNYYSREVQSQEILMNIEEIYFKLFLLVAFILGPAMTQVFIFKGKGPKTYALAHKIVIAILILGELTHLKFLALAWPAFCIYGLIILLRLNKISITTHPLTLISNTIVLFLNPRALLELIALGFSIGGSFWFLGGVFNFDLLGYDAFWCYLTALHFNFLGWLLIGSLSHLSHYYDGIHSKIFLLGGFLVTGFFMLVAMGFHGVPYVKLLAVPGLSLGVPFLLLWHFIKTFKQPNTYVTLFAGISVLVNLTSMVLAVAYEFSVTLFGNSYNIHNMVSTHGLLNAFVVIPALLISLFLMKKYPHQIHYRERARV